MILNGLERDKFLSQSREQSCFKLIHSQMDDSDDTKSNVCVLRASRCTRQRKYDFVQQQKTDGRSNTNISYRQIERPTDRQTGRQTGRQTDRPTNTQTDRPTDTQTDRQTTARQTDRPTQRPTNVETEQIGTDNFRCNAEKPVNCQSIFKTVLVIHWFLNTRYSQIQNVRNVGISANKRRHTTQ